MGTRRWTKAEIDYLLNVYAGRSNADIAVFLHRSARAIGLKARSLGVHKSPEFAERQHKVGQFKPGHKPFNAGRKIEHFMSAEGIANSSRTRFQPGVERETSPTYRQPGFEILRSPDKTGRRYWWIKPHDGRRMMYKHRYIWEQAHGPIPKGMNIQFKDGDTTNCVLDNLYLISRAAQVRKNWDNLPDERKAACRAKGNDKRNKSIRADKLRLKWGLEPLGRLVKRTKIMDIQKELNLLLQKVGKICPTLLFIGKTTDKHGAFMMGSPEKTDEQRKIDLTATVAMMMDQRKELREVLFSAVSWFMQENPKYRDAMQEALNKLKELDEHQRTAEPE